MNAPKGLRERKKHRQRLDLIEAAARLFRQNGYDATRMDDIAAAGEVSTYALATVPSGSPATWRAMAPGVVNQTRSR